MLRDERSTIIRALMGLIKCQNILQSILYVRYLAKVSQNHGQTCWSVGPERPHMVAHGHTLWYISSQSHGQTCWSVVKLTISS